jgi:hypothetical protein
MPTYKLLGIFSFADNLKKININDTVILKNEKYNIKSKSAIGVYTLDNNKIGYLPIENQDEINNFNDAYKISNLILNKEYPVVEISRFYSQNNYLDNIEYQFEKKIKYEYVLTNISIELQQSVIKLEKYLLTKKIKVKKSAVIYYDDNYINILIEISKGIEQFECITLKYFKENIDKYEELYENKLIENTIFRELLFYRLECYFEKNYKSSLKLPEITNINLLKYINNIIEDQIHDTLELNYKKIDNILLIKLYLRYLFHNNSEYILKYINNLINIKYDDVEKAIKKIIPNYKLIKNQIENYNLVCGKFTYHHKYEMYEYIDFTNESTVFIISEEFKINYLYNALLTNKNNIIIYNPILGSIIKINNIDLSLFNK